MWVASDGSGDQNQDQDKLSLSDQSGSTEPTPERFYPSPPSPVYIEDLADLRADESSTNNASLTPVRMSTPDDLDRKLGVSSQSEAGGDGHSLASWLTPQTKENIRKKPKKNKGSLHLQADTRTEQGFSQRQQWGARAAASGENGGGARECSSGGRLSAWLEPSGEPAVGKKPAKPAGGKGKVGAVVHRSRGQSDEEEGDSAKWMSERLGGLDPSGEARYATCVATAVFLTGEAYVPPHVFCDVPILFVAMG